MAITSTGLGSGLDIDKIVKQLVAVEGAPTTRRLDRQEVELQAELSAFGTLKGALSSFQSTLTSLNSTDAFLSRSSSVSDTKVFSATSSSSAAPGNYSLNITQLAKAHSIYSSGFAATTDAIGTGTLTFTFGTDNAGTFTANPDKTIETVKIETKDNSLIGIRDAVNAAKIGVNASVIYNGTQNQLVFTSADTGKANSLKITVAEDGGSPTNTDMNGLSQLAYDPEAGVGSGKNLTQADSGVDAALTINGLAVTSASNTLSKTIEGVTIDLLTTGAATLSVTDDISTAEAAVGSFVSSYNAVIAAIDDISGYDADTKLAGVLLGNPTVRGVANQLRNMIATTVEGVSGAYNSLAAIGVITNATSGELEIDSTKLSKATTGNVENIAAIFSSFGGISDPLIEYVSASASTTVGSYAVNITQLSTKGVFTGNDIGAFPLTIDANNDGFSMKVDGVQSDMITLSQRSYSSGSELATEMQSRINADSSLSSAGVSVKVAYVSGGTDYFTITSDRYGSASKITMISVDTNSATIGLVAGSGVDGVDVAGTIGGYTATGSGQTLTGSSAAAGLKLNITGGSIGSRGTIDFSRGYADLIGSYLTALLDSEGTLESRTDSLSGRIEDISGERENLARRLVGIEARLRSKFNAMDALVGQLNATSSFLTQQLANLPKFGGNRK